MFYAGAGISGRLDVLNVSEIPPTFGTSPTVVIGLIAEGDTALCNPVGNTENNTSCGQEEPLQYHINNEDTVIGTAASNTIPYVIGAVCIAREHEILTGCITSNPNPPMATEADIPMEMIVDPEHVTGSSRMKLDIAQKIIPDMINTTIMIRLGHMQGDKMVNIQLSNQKPIGRGTYMITEEPHLNYEKAKAFLLLHGSVKSTIETYRKHNSTQ